MSNIAKVANRVSKLSLDIVNFGADGIVALPSDDTQARQGREQLLLYAVMQVSADAVLFLALCACNSKLGTPEFFDVFSEFTVKLLVQ